MPQPENHINNYYLLQRLVKELNEKIHGNRLGKCFSLSKSELVFIFSEDDQPVNIKLNFGDVSLISFPVDSPKPGRNTKNIFEKLHHLKVLECYAHPQDRSFRIAFEHGYSLVFMMYGKNGNIILFHKNEQVEIFRQQFEKHKTILLSAFDAYTLPDCDTFSELSRNNDAISAVKQLFPGFSPLMVQYLDAHDISSKTIPDQCEQVKKLESVLLSGPIDIVQYGENDEIHIILTLLPTGFEGDKTYSTFDVFEAVNEFSSKYLYEKHFRELKISALASVKAGLDKAGKQLDSATQTLKRLEHDNNYKQLADIIMANLHVITPGLEMATLFNFYTNQEQLIALKREMSPQLWAEKLYRKSKNQEIERQKTIAKINDLEAELKKSQLELSRIESIENYKELKLVSKVSEKEIKSNIVLPYRHFNIDGFDIYVGKSAANNDKLSFGFAHKDDLWLHAQGVSGSHVIIRNKQRTVFPQPVIEKAAKLAAWYSKNKGSIMSPVIYTLCKFVRKPKGAAPGAVICEKEQMIMVEPGLV